MTRHFPHLVDGIKTTTGGLPAGPQFVNYPGMSDAPEYAEIGARLRAIREGFSDLKQKEWAEAHRFGVTQYNNWELGVRRIPVDSAELLADRYGLDLDFIYRGRRDGLSDRARKVL